MKDIERKRQDLIAAYSGRQWQQKVIKMSEAQVVAVHMRLKSQGKI